jgi:hypothetical protein
VDVIALFPYILNEYNLPNINEYSRWDAGMGLQTTVLENEIRVHYDNLEPTQDNNVGIWMLQPHLWQEILRRRTQAISYPDDAGAWAALSRAYAAAGNVRGIMSFTAPFILTCERALTLNPNDVSLHVLFANAMYDDWLFEPDNDYYHALAVNEVAAALKLDPANAQALALMQSMGLDQNSLPTPGPFPVYATPTPTLTPPAGPSMTPYASITPFLTWTPTASPTRRPTLTPTSIPKPWTAEFTQGNSRGTLMLVLLALVLLAGAGYLNWRSVRKK